MVSMLAAVAQPGIVPAVAPVLGMPLVSIPVSIPLVALLPLAFLGAGLVSVLVLLAKEEQARKARLSRTATPGEPPFREAA